jgi:hypothetical protein
MRRRSTLTEHEAHLARLAWWAAFLFTIAAIAVLGMVRSAQAAILTLDPGSSTPLAVESADDEGEEPEAGEVEECEEEDEEADECAVAANAGEASVPNQCRLRSASATVSVLAKSDRVRLALRYTTVSPAAVSVEYALRGGRGALKTGEDVRHFSREGVFRDSETLSDTEMIKARAATKFEVRVHAVNSPRHCHRLFDQELTVKHAAHGALIWTSPPPPARSAPR